MNDGTAHTVGHSRRLSAAFGMYPFESVRWAWDDLWSGVSSRVPWFDPQMDHCADVERCWADAAVDANFVCGWPLAAYHLDTMAVIGAFVVDLPDEPPTPPGFYRSVLVAALPSTIEDLFERDATVAINQSASLSGALSFRSATAHLGPWRGDVIETGAHLDSLKRLTCGDADVACIDSWTLALLRNEQPDLVASVHRIGFGPMIPTPALTLRRAAGPVAAEQYAEVWRDTLADPTHDEARAALMISGWVPHPEDVYTATLLLGPRFTPTADSRR